MKIALLLFVCVMLTGCAQSVDYVTYREALHRLDAALYQQHRDLLQDATAKGVRSSTDVDTVNAEIAAAEDLYAKSRVNTPSPATQP